MVFKYVKPIESIECIQLFESKMNFQFPDSFRLMVKEYNGGRPEKRTFDTRAVQGRELKTFLSFNENDTENIWSINQYQDEIFRDKYIAFAIDHFGNLICFEKTGATIVFFDHEIENVEYIAENFDAFIDALKSQ